LVPQDKEGIVTVKTNQAIIIAYYPDTVQPGEAAKVVQQLADYLIGNKY
jgi:profilin